VARKLRFIPEPGALVLVTTRVLHGRFLLKPCRELNDLLVGVLGRAQRLTSMEVCFYTFQSNHEHLLLRPTDALQLSRFMTFVNSNIAKEAGSLYSWREKFWGRRYADSIVSHEPEAQIHYLTYCLAQGCKEGLVASPKHWPGATATKSLTTGENVTGTWIDRSAQYRAHLAGKPTDEALFASVETLELSPIPCWDELNEKQRQTRVRHLVKQIESETAEALGGRAVLGKQAILAQDPYDSPKRFKRSPAPRFLAVQPEVRRALEWAYRLFRLEHRQAAEDRKLGRTHFTYPPGSFPGPGLFVPLAAPT
jgi:hypothetical protein